MGFGNMPGNMVTKEDLYINVFVIVRKDIVSVNCITQERIYVKFGSCFLLLTVRRMVIIP